MVHVPKHVWRHGPCADTCVPTYVCWDGPCADTCVPTWSMCQHMCADMCADTVHVPIHVCQHGPCANTCMPTWSMCRHMCANIVHVPTHIEDSSTYEQAQVLKMEIFDEKYLRFSSWILFLQPIKKNSFLERSSHHPSFWFLNISQRDGISDNFYNANLVSCWQHRVRSYSAKQNKTKLLLLFYNKNRIKNDCFYDIFVYYKMAGQQDKSARQVFIKNYLIWLS